MAALAEGGRLVKACTEFRDSKRAREGLQKSLDVPRSRVSVGDTEVPADATEDPLPPNEPVLGVLLSRSRTDESSVGQIVFAMAKDSCYAIDATTGELIWRRIIGMNSPFFP